MRLRHLLIVAAAALAMPAGLWAQSATGLVIPQYAQNGTANRLPMAFLVQINGLTPSVTYRYIQQAVNPTEAAEAGPTFTNGAGNPIYVTNTGSFVYSTSTSLTTAGGYGEFTTDSAGSYTGWFGLVPTGNARFTAGSTVHLRIRTNDGAGGTTAVNFLTVAEGVTVAAFGATAADTTGVTGTASPLAAQDFIVLYDNTAGTGRPLFAAPVQQIGATVATSVAFSTTAEGTNTAWAAAVPNTLPNGIRRLEQRARVGGAVVTAFQDADGTWPSGLVTVNPTGGTTPLTFVNPTDYVSSVSDWQLY